MKPNGKEADPMSATVIEISSHPRFKPVEFTFNTGGPDPVSEPKRPEARYLRVAETAKLVRVALKKAFPGVKFSVVSSSYSGGSSIRVKWYDGPASDEVRKVAGIFSGADFDGMIDLKTYINHWLLPDGTVTVAYASGTGGSGGSIPGIPLTAKPHPDAEYVSMGADFIFCDRYTSEAK